MHTCKLSVYNMFNFGLTIHSFSSLMCVCVVVDHRECNGSLIMSTIEDGRKQFRGEECSSVALGIGPEKRGGSGEKQLKHCGHV